MTRSILAIAAALFLVACGGIAPTNDEDTEETDVPVLNDIDCDGVIDGEQDPVVNDGQRIMVHKSIVPNSGGGAPMYVYGEGFGGETDWERSIHVAQISADGNWYSYEFFSTDSPCTVYSVNFALAPTNVGGAGPDNWAVFYNMAQSDPLVATRDDGSLALEFAVCQGVNDVIAHGGPTCNASF